MSFAYPLMVDKIIEQTEMKLLKTFFGLFKTPKKVLDVGCGNGSTIKGLSDFSHHFCGVDINDKSVPKELNFRVGNAISLPFPDKSFDIVYTKRCLQNLLEDGQQQRGLDEIWRILKNDGYYLMIESFTDGLDNLNKARQEYNLPKVFEAEYNKYFDKDKFTNMISRFKRISFPEIDSNFLSSPYFITRVIHPLLTKDQFSPYYNILASFYPIFKQLKKYTRFFRKNRRYYGFNDKDTEFVKFLSLLNPVGNYAPTQAYILKKEE